MSERNTRGVIRWVSIALAAVAIGVLAIATAMAAGPLASAKPKLKPISAASAFSFPPTRACVAGHVLTFQIRKVRHVRWSSVAVFVNGRHVETVKLFGHARPVRVRGLPSGRFVLRVIARTSDGRRVTASRTYHACVSPPTKHTLTVTLSGSGSGTVTGSGISCPGTCSLSYTAGTKATLTASPASGSSFSGWSGGGCSGTGSCTVTMSTNESVSASFAANPPPTHTLTVSLAGSGSGTVTGSGISCPGTCSHSYAAGTMVTLTASPTSGSSFSGWSGGGCSGTGSCTVTMSANESVSASFAANPPPAHTLTVALTGSGSGTVTGSGISCPGTCSHSYTAGTMVVLTASPASGSSFSGWSGGGCSGTGTCTVTMSSDQSVTATFTATHALTVSLAGTGSGTVTGGGISCPSTCSQSYTAGTMVTLTASPASGSSFSGWSGGGCSGTGTCTVTMSSDQAVSATFLAGPQPGSYSGSTSQSISFNGITLYVSADSTQLQDVTIGAVSLSCTPSTPSPNPSPWGSFSIASIPINADGSFSSSTTEATVIGNAPVHVTYTLSGQFTGTNVAGSVQEDISYDGSSTTCTSSLQTWTAKLDTQGNQAALAPPAGSYSGITSQPISFNDVTLYVSPDSTELQDVTIGAVGLACAPSTPSPNPSPWGSFSIASIPINGDGSFSSTTTEATVIGNAPVHITYTLSGHFHGRNSSDNERVAGLLREDVSYDGLTTSCTSGDQFWSATWQSSQGNQAALAPPAGSYSGITSQPISFNDVTLYVSPDSTELQDVTVGAVALSCTPSTPSPNPSPWGSFYIASIPIGADGSFSSTTTETTVVRNSNSPVHITFTFSGHFHGQNSSDNERVAGLVREDVSYDGLATSCTSGDQFWSATWQSSQGNQAALAPPAGSYSGITSQPISFNDVTLYVSPDSIELQDVTVGAVGLACAPSTPSPNPSPRGSFYIASIPIGADGSFSSTTTEATVIGNAPVHITYTLSGHFHGRNSSDNERIAGLVREDLTYDGATTSCTSGNQFWSATWQSSQGNQAALAPPAGSYSGITSQPISFNGITLYVSPDSSQLQDVTIGSVALSCSPSTPSPTPSPWGSFYIASIPIGADGSFSATSTETTVVGNAPVHVTYTLSGHFHGQNSSDNERVAGVVREDVSYDGLATSCTSGDQFWSATWQSSQGNQAALAPPAGSYSGITSQPISFNGVTLSVSSDSTELQNVAIGAVALACTPSTPTHNPSPDGSFSIASIPIGADGSFSGTVIQTGFEAGDPVHFTYTFSGHFHGRNTSNKERIAGTFREDISYDGMTTSCTSGNQFWSATQQ